MDRRETMARAICCPHGCACERGAWVGEPCFAMRYYADRAAAAIAADEAWLGERMRQGPEILIMPGPKSRPFTASFSTDEDEAAR